MRRDSAVRRVAAAWRAGTPPFPTEPAQLTAAWLTDVLRASTGLAHLHVIGCRWEPVAAQGGAALVVRVWLDYDRQTSGQPATVVVKFAARHPPMRGVMHRFGLYRAEVGFYRDLARDAGIPTPRCHHAAIDDASGHFAIVLEDLQDGRAGDPLCPEVADVETAIDHVAGLHGRWWRHPRLRTLDWLVYPHGPAFEARAAALPLTYAHAATAVRQGLGPAFPPILAEACDRIFEGWPAFVAARLPQAPTLVHRDFHPQQMFFPSGRGGRFAVFDWQTVSVGTGADDVARILAMGLTRADRAAHQTRLVDRYHARLRSHGVDDYPYEQCVRDVRLGLTGSLLTNVIATSALDLSAFAARESATGVTFVYAVFDRLAAAFEANDVLALLPPRA
ncbi:MAG: phosphotransferase [Vicinamibacterales bacterium]